MIRRVNFIDIAGRHLKYHKSGGHYSCTSGYHNSEIFNFLDCNDPAFFHKYLGEYERGGWPVTDDYRAHEKMIYELAKRWLDKDRGNVVEIDGVTYGKYNPLPEHHKEDNMYNEGSIFHIDKYKFRVYPSYLELECDGIKSHLESCDRFERDLRARGYDLKRLAREAYGYEPSGNPFPQYRSRDYSAMNRIVKKFIEIFDKSVVRSSSYPTTRYKKGNTVRITKSWPSRNGGWESSWTSVMDHFIGQTGVVKEDRGTQGVIVTHPSYGSYYFPHHVVELVSDEVYPDIKFNPGDKVTITRKADSHERGWNNSWVDAMNSYVGKTVVVTRDFGETGVGIEGTSNKFPHFVISKYDSATAHAHFQNPTEKVVKKKLKTGDLDIPVTF